MLYTTTFFLILYISYFVVFPLSKRRPVFIRDTGLVIFTLIFSLLTYSSIGLEALLVGSIVTVLTKLLRVWFVCGITKTQVTSALERASSVTRAKIDTVSGSYIINNNILVQVVSLSKVHLISFGVKTPTNKSILTKDVFRKLIQNYYIK